MSGKVEYDADQHESLKFLLSENWRIVQNICVIILDAFYVFIFIAILGIIIQTETSVVMISQVIWLFHEVAKFCN